MLPLLSQGFVDGQLLERETVDEGLFSVKLRVAGCKLRVGCGTCLIQSFGWAEILPALSTEIAI